MAHPAGLNYSVRSGGASPAELPPLILIHGAGGDRNHWPPELSRLPGETVYAVDLPGHGASKGGEASIGAFAERLLDWARQMDIGRAVWVGHSMGGAIALTLALRRPSAAAGLVILGCGGDLDVHPELMRLLRSDFASAVARITQLSYSPAAPERLVTLAHRRLVQVAPQVLHQDFAACDRFDELERLKEIETPVLVLCGQDDRMTPVAKCRELAEGVHDGRLVVVPNAGHMLKLEQPGEVAAALSLFLKEISSRQPA